MSVAADTPCARSAGLGTLPGCGTCAAPAFGGRPGGGWDMHRAGGDALVTVRTVLLQLYWVSARRVLRARSRAHERPAPDRQRAHHETEPTPAVGEPVRGARRTLRVEFACDQALAFHPPQAIRKQLWRDSGQLSAEILESRRSSQQVAHDQERPALANQIERLRDWAVLTVPLRHATSIAARIATLFVSSQK
jgi:hypothetical protein